MVAGFFAWLKIIGERGAVWETLTWKMAMYGLLGPFALVCAVSEFLRARSLARLRKETQNELPGGHE